MPAMLIRILCAVNSVRLRAFLPEETFPNREISSRSQDAPCSSISTCHDVLCPTVLDATTADGSARPIPISRGSGRESVRPARSAQSEINADADDVPRCPKALSPHGLKPIQTELENLSNS